MMVFGSDSTGVVVVVLAAVGDEPLGKISNDSARSGAGTLAAVMAAGAAMLVEAGVPPAATAAAVNRDMARPRMAFTGAFLFFVVFIGGIVLAGPVGM